MADTPAPRVRTLIHGLEALRRGQPGELRVTLARIRSRPAASNL